MQEQLDSLESRGEPGQSEPCLKRLSIARDVYKGYCAELAELGCSLVDQEAGAVEFLAVIGGRQIALSWKPSEPEVAFWHDLGQETSTRRPLTDLADKAEGRIESDAS